MNNPVSELGRDSDSADVPILLIVWRRADTLRQVIEALRPLAPRRLFVACDGANPERTGEADKVAATRAVVDQEIDWPCTIQRLYSESNLGCSRGPVAAINWFFDHVEEGIILEDDCVPHSDFLTFCSVLLERYRHDMRVWCISGNNFQDGRRTGADSYYFSRYASCWGWATWRSRWKHFDREICTWPWLRDSGLLPSLFSDPIERRYWALIWERTHNHPESATWWDYQWQYAIVSHHGLSITPAVNLVRNVGFGAGASHTVSDDPLHYSCASLPLGPMRHPVLVIHHGIADQHLFYRNYLAAFRRHPRAWLLRLKSWLLLMLEAARLRQLP